MVAALEIDIVSDVVCPWCFIGKRKLEKALALYAARQPAAPVLTVHWRPFQLNPQLPETGMARAEYVARKFGARGSEVYARVAAAGKTVGIEFAFDKIARQPNTLAAHSLIALAQQHGKQDEVVEALFKAYFIDGADLTRRDVLTGIAVGAGLPRDVVTACLADAATREAVAQEDAHARARGVEGVPFFIFNQRDAVSGAQDPEVLLGAILKADRDTVAAASPAA